MKMLYSVHYTDSDSDDYRAINKYTLSVPEYEDAEMLMNLLKEKGKSPVLVCTPFFYEELTQE